MVSISARVGCSVGGRLRLRSFRDDSQGLGALLRAQSGPSADEGPARNENVRFFLAGKQVDVRSGIICSILMSSVSFLRRVALLEFAAELRAIHLYISCPVSRFICVLPVVGG